jgi:hypothetical protein
MIGRVTGPRISITGLGCHVPERVLTLKHPAVGSMLCESTAKVFYWVGLRQTFRDYLTKE